MSVPIGGWDLALVATVSAQCTLIAYLHAPRWKALFLSLPIPFTFASLALGSPVNVTHVTGILVFVAFAHLVRFLHVPLGRPIIECIVVAATALGLAAGGLARLLPLAERAFWTAAAVVMLIAFLLNRRMPHRTEPGHRSPLPLWIKLPIVTAVIVTLVLLKQGLKGFMTSFPMVTIVTVYEARHSLWTICRQTSLIALGMVPMMIAIFLAQGALGPGWALAIGWAVYLSVILPLTKEQWKPDWTEKGQEALAPGRIPMTDLTSGKSAG